MTPSSRHRIRNSSPGGLRPARYLSVTEAPHNTNFHTWMGKKHFCFFQTAETGNRTPNSGVKGSGANHYPRAPAHLATNNVWTQALIYPDTGPMLRHVGPAHYSSIAGTTEHAQIDKAVNNQLMVVECRCSVTDSDPASPEHWANILSAGKR